MATDYEEYPKIGLYQHFKGSYFFLYNLLRDSVKDCQGYVCEYFNILHPEYGHFARPEDQWFTDVSEREDNVTGQIHRFERVVSIDTSMENFTTEQLMKELSTRKDSPLQSLDVAGLSERVAAVDYAVGRVLEIPKDGSKGVSVEASFTLESEARDYWMHHSCSKSSEVFKRTFLAVD